MPEATFPRTGFSPVLSLVAAQLASALSYASQRVIVTAMDFDDCPHLLGETDVLLRPGKESALPAREGGGRAVNLRDRELKVAVRTRYHADIASGDVEHYTRASLGHFALEDAVTDALESFCAHDSDSDLLALPLLVGDWSEARRGGQGQQKEKSGWLMSWAPVRVRYLRDLAQP